MSPPIRAGRTPDGLVVSLHPIQSHAQVIDAWRRLAGEALVDNLFYEPDFAIGAGRAFGQGVSLLTVGVPSSGAVQENLLAAWPFRVVRRWGLPLPVLMGWTHPFSVFGAPLLLRDEPERALRGLLEASQALGLPRRLMMPFLPLDGPFAEVADSVLGAYGGRRADFWQHERGALDLAGRDRQARETYLHTQLSDRKERQLARLFRRLEASGAVIHETIRDPGALSAALEDYFALESRGWKGSRATVEQLGDEIADCIICLDSLARAYGLHLPEIISAKFNATSEANGFPHWLAAEPASHPCKLPAEPAGDEPVERDNLGRTDADLLRLIAKDHQRLAPSAHHSADTLREIADRMDLPATPPNPERKFTVGQRVTKTKGSSWTGRIVGFYSTAFTAIGYAVESEAETGSVQIYPEAALSAAPITASAEEAQ